MKWIKNFINTRYNESQCMLWMVVYWNGRIEIDQNSKKNFFYIYTSVLGQRETDSRGNISKRYFSNACLAILLQRPLLTPFQSLQNWFVQFFERLILNHRLLTHLRLTTLYYFTHHPVWWYNCIDNSHFAIDKVCYLKPTIQKHDFHQVGWL